VSVNHRLAPWLASYFDILFALNRALHPGEKRLALYVEEECLCKPEHWKEDLDEALAASDPLPALDRLSERLAQLRSRT
jgi:hypothetical protein